MVLDGGREGGAWVADSWRAAAKVRWDGEKSEWKRKKSERECIEENARRLLPLSASIEGTRRNEREDRPDPFFLVVEFFFSVFLFASFFFFSFFLHASRNRRGRKRSNRFGRTFDFGSGWIVIRIDHRPDNSSRSETAFRFNLPSRNFHLRETTKSDSREDSSEKRVKNEISKQKLWSTALLRVHARDNITVDRKTGFVIPLISFLFIQGAIHVADAREARGLLSVRVQWRAKPSPERSLDLLFPRYVTLFLSFSRMTLLKSAAAVAAAAAAAVAAARLFPSRGCRINSYSPL